MNQTPSADESRASMWWTLFYWFCQVAGWGTYVAIGLWMAIAQTGVRTGTIVGYALFFGYSIALTHAFRRVIEKREWLSLPPGQALARVTVGAFVTGTLLTALVVLVDFARERNTAVFAGATMLFFLWANITVATGMWTTIFVGISALFRGLRARKRAAALEHGLSAAKLKMLEAQISPHFLFNCLNSIRGMIAENPPQAQDMVTRLANILRHNLARDASPTESLGEQIEFTTDYLALESIRFEERLRTRLDIDAATRAQAVPAMLLQTLVENAVKHGISHLPDGGEIAISSRFDADALVITVENTGRLVPTPPGSTRVGLANLRERLRVLHGATATLDLSETEANTVRASVRIPRIASQ